MPGFNLEGGSAGAPQRLSDVVTDAQIEAAGDALRSIWESEEAKRAGGVAWWFLAQTALEAAAMLDGKVVLSPPERSQ